MSNPDWTEAPEGATHWDTRGAVWCKHLHFWYYGRWNHEGAIHDLAEDRYTPRPTEPAPTAWPTAWNGTGFPPVGTKCEGVWLEVPDGGDRVFEVVIVKGYYKKQVWFCTTSGEDITHLTKNVDFRPIRTQAQIKREEATDFAARAYLSDRLESAPNLSGEQARKIAAFFYDAGMLKLPECHEATKP